MAFEDLRIEMKCKDFRIEIEEGLKGESLSIAAQDHAAGCRPCHEFNQKHIELREWIAVCRKITAPKNFQFGVQRKIAGAGAAHSHGWAWNRLRYIVPSTALTAILVLAGLYAFTNRTVITSNNPGVATLSENESGVRPASNDTAVNPATAQPVEPNEEKIASVLESNKQDNSRVETIKGGKPDSPSIKNGRSLDSAAHPVEDPEKPAGLNSTGRGNSAANRSKALIAMQSFGAITGVADMKVKEVKENTAAARSGVKKGDVVESVNGDVVTIKRGGKTLQITVQ